MAPFAIGEPGNTAQDLGRGTRAADVVCLPDRRSHQRGRPFRGRFPSGASGLRNAAIISNAGRVSGRLGVLLIVQPAELVAGYDAQRGSRRDAVNEVGVLEITFQNRTRRFPSDHRIGPKGIGAAG